MCWDIPLSLGPTHSLGEQGKRVSTETTEMSSSRCTANYNSVCVMSYKNTKISFTITKPSI